MSDHASIRGFAKAFMAHWLTAMSGAMSVPLTIMGIFAQNDAVKYSLLGTALLCLAIASFRVWKDERVRRIAAEFKVAELTAERKAIYVGPNTSSSALDIQFLKDDRHEIIEVFQVGTIRRTLKVSVYNRGNGWLSNCRLSIEKTSPSIHDTPIELISGFSLQSGEKRFCILIYLDEKFPAGHSASRVLLPQLGSFFATDFGFALDCATVFELKATSSDPKDSVTKHFKAFVEEGCLKMIRI